MDLNRDFPDKFDSHSNRVSPGGNIVDGRQSETAAMMKWIVSQPVVLSGNFHGGAVVASYPYDSGYVSFFSPFPIFWSENVCKKSDYELIVVGFSKSVANRANRRMTNSSNIWLTSTRTITVKCLEATLVRPIISKAALPTERNGTILQKTDEMM